MTLLPQNHKYRRTKGTSLTVGKQMGLVYAEIDLTNELDIALNMGGILPESDVRRVGSRALVDSGAYDLVSRPTTVRAAVVPGTSEVLLGTIPMEGLDVVIDPVRERLLVNPESPDAPMSYLKKCA